MPNVNDRLPPYEHADQEDPEVERFQFVRWGVWRDDLHEDQGGEA